MTFDRPPLNEVVLSLQSESVKGFTTPYWVCSGVESATPLETQTQPPLDPVVERFEGTPKPTPMMPFRVLETIETPRCWFVTRGGQQLIQLQQDRLILNWRRIQVDDVYPRYERLRPELERVANELALFFEQEGLGNVVPNQCEVSYINHIEAAEWAQRGELHRVLSFWQRISATGLPESGRCNGGYSIRDGGSWHQTRAAPRQSEVCGEAFGQQARARSLIDRPRQTSLGRSERCLAVHEWIEVEAGYTSHSRH